MSMQAIPLTRIKNFIAKPDSAQSSDTDPENFNSWGERIATVSQPTAIANPISWPDPDSITGISEHPRGQL